MSDLISRQDALDAIQKRADIVNSVHSAFWEGLIIAQDIVNNIPSAEPERRWIPVTERLPEEEYVLISKKPTKLSGSKWCVTIAIRTADPRSKKVNWRDIGFSVIPDDNLLAWMPLPEPWRGE